MSEWWTYGLSDFLMFSPQAYGRLVARYNAAWWPAQVVGIAAAVALPLLVRRRTPAGARIALLILALAWASVGWAFHWQRYTEIFLAAPWMAGAFGVETVLLLAAAFVSVADAQRDRPGMHAAAWLLLALALLYPLLAPLTGHLWSEAEVFGFMPDPTALATLGVLLAPLRMPAWTRALVALVPVLSLLLGAATRWLLA